MVEGEKAKDGTWMKRLVVFGIGMSLVVAVVIGALALSTRPEPVKAQPVYAAAPEITPADVFVRPPAPSGDNRTADIQVDIEMKNVGKGGSGVLLVWCGAFDHEQPNLLWDDFSTSSLRKMDDGSVTDRIAADGTTGCVVRLSGRLQLPPGDYDVRLRIYENGANRTLVNGLVRLIVEKDSVTVPDPFKPEGSAGRSSPAPQSKGASGADLPGFEALGALGATGLALVVMMGKRRRTSGKREAGSG